MLNILTVTCLCGNVHGCYTYYCHLTVRSSGVPDWPAMHPAIEYINPRSIWYGCETSRPGEELEDLLESSKSWLPATTHDKFLTYITDIANSKTHPSPQYSDHDSHNNAELHICAVPLCCLETIPGLSKMFSVCYWITVHSFIHGQHAWPSALQTKTQYQDVCHSDVAIYYNQ